MKILQQHPAVGLYVLALVALVGDIVAYLRGIGTVPLLDSVVLAALTGGAAISTPAPPAAPRPPAADEQVQP